MEVQKMREDSKLLTVVVPAYNAETFIDTAINSFLEQNAEWAEMIIVDDGSKDKTYEKCKPYISDNVKYYRTENAGAGHARNFGMEKATGKWISFLDSDDLIGPDALQTSYETLVNSESDIIYCSMAKCDMELKEELRIYKPEKVENIKNKMPLLEFCSSFYRRSYLSKNNIKFFEYREQDIESAFRFRAFSKTNNIEVNEDVILIIYRNNPSSNVNTWNTIILNKVKSLVFLKLFEEYNGEDRVVSKNLYTIYLYCFMSLITECVKIGIPKDRKKDFKLDIITLSKGLKLRKSVTLKFKSKMFCILCSVLSTDFFAGLFTKICKTQVK